MKGQKSTKDEKSRGSNASSQSISQSGCGQNVNIMFIVLALLMASISINIALILHPEQSPFYSTARKTRTTTLKPLNKVKMDLHSKKEHLDFAKAAFDEASKYSGERGEGRQGWLNLLKSWDYDNSDTLVGENLIRNYVGLEGYEPIGYAELKAANWSQTKIKRVYPDYAKAEEQLETTKKQWQNRYVDPGEGCTTVGFATAFGKWDLSSVLRNVTKLNEDIYKASVQAYLQLKDDKPELNATDLNHELWKLQRSVLDRETNSYWGGFQDIDGFNDLVFAMRHAAKRFLGDTHGLAKDDAERKASHPLVVWVSVHTMESVHQPHVTLDALVGGVYYVSVPRGSGRLELYDPRGKSPLDLSDPTAASLPPFHRTIGVQPNPGTLILFPGWLVHSVLPSSMNSAKDGYRVSISLNLKGEWQTTGGLSFGCPTYETSS